MNGIIEFILNLFAPKKPTPKQEAKSFVEESKVDPKPYLITESEILKKIKKEDLPKEHQDNLAMLLERINKVRYAWNKPMTVTSGYRSMADHIRIYKELAVKRKIDYDESNVPMGSNHLKCAAVDISDPDGKLYEWVRINAVLMEEIGLWMEEADDQARVHFQIFAYGSWKPEKSRFFKA